MTSAAQVALLHGGNDADASLLATLQGRGWNVQQHNMFDASGECRCHTVCKDIGVGLITLSDVSIDELRRLEASLSLSLTPWIAIVKESDLDIREVRCLITSLCLGFVTHPVELTFLETLLKNASHHAHLLRVQRDADTALEERLSSDACDYEMVGTAPVMKELFKVIRKVAVVDASVCIHGETGTGKELTARAIHEHSARATGPFQAINCGALPASLIQSELFGHEKGAFTGAVQRKVGRIEAADGGTLFLDEVGDLPLELQVNLLRFLEERKVQRVGGLEDIDVDVRILAATHVDLARAVEEGKFREDLYHRLNVLKVDVPALREHPEDIEVMAHFFFTRFASEKPAALKGFSRESLALMRQYAWPGNVRELINRIRRAVVMCEGRLIQPVDLGIERRQNNREIMTLEQARDRAEHDAIQAALARNKQLVNAAAESLGVSRVTMYRLLHKHHIK